MNVANLNVANLFKRSSAPATAIICEDANIRLSIKVEQKTFTQLAAELKTGHHESVSGVLLGMVFLHEEWTKVEVGACPLLRSGSLRLPGENRDEIALEAELKNYPRATPRAPGCVGYLSVGVPGQHGPAKEEQELFLRRFTSPTQVFLFARRSETGRLTPQFFSGKDGRLVPLPISAAREQDAVDLSKRQFWGIGALLVIAVAGGLLSTYRNGSPVETGKPDRFTITPVAPESKALQLTVTREDNSLTLQWDPEAPVIQSAQTGLLEIEDGERKAQQTLDPADLRNGRLVYVSSNSNVRFRMDLLTETGAIETASIRVLGLTPSFSTRLGAPVPLPATDSRQIEMCSRKRTLFVVESRHLQTLPIRRRIPPCKSNLRSIPARWK